MSSDTDLPHEQDSIQQKPPYSFKPRKLLALLAAVLLSALLARTVGYILGIRAGQKSEFISQAGPIATTTPTPTVPLTAPVLPTQIPILTANWKTYTDEEFGISFNYPKDWDVSEEKQEGNIMLGPSIVPCPSNVNPLTCETAESIYIRTIDNRAANISLTDFLNKKYGQFKPIYTSVIINGVEGLHTNSIPGQFEQEYIFIKNNSKIYNIEWIKNLGMKRITKEVFNKILSTLQFAC
jgi:hypothetical protein